MEVYNKIDLLDEEKQKEFERKARFSDRILMISAQNKCGFDELLDEIDDTVGMARVSARFSIDYSDGKALSWLHDHSEILERDDFETGVRVLISIEPSELSKFTSRFGYEPQQ